MTEQESLRLREMEVKMAAMEPTLQRIDNEFFNHDGGPGLKTIVIGHISAVKQHDAEVEKQLEKTDLILNGPPGNPEGGFVHQVLSYLEDDKKRSWTRSQKISVAACVVPIVLAAIWFCTVNVYIFVKRVDAAIKAIDEIHQTRVMPQKEINSQGPVGEIQSAHANRQQFAGGLLNPDRR